VNTPVLVALLVAAAAPGLRIVSKPPALNELRGRPGLVAILFVGAAAVALAGIALVRRQPATLPVVAIGLLAINVVAWWRARPAWGRSRSLPPGSLGLGRSLDALSDPDFYADCALRWGPVFKSAQFHRPVACITDLPVGLTFLRQREADLTSPRLPFGRVSPGHYIAFLSDREHPGHRPVLTRILLPEVSSGEGVSLRIGSELPVVQSCADDVACCVRDGLHELAGSRPEAGVDPEEYLSRICYGALLRAVTGESPRGETLDGLRAWFGGLGRPVPFAERRPEERPDSFEPLVDWVYECGTRTRRRIEANEQPPASVLTETLSADPRALDDRVLLGNLVLLVHVTFSNVRGILGWVLKEALDHPDRLHEIREACERDESTANRQEMASRFVRETLRLHQSEFLYREVVRPTELAEFRIPRGWLVRVCVREAHRNGEVFEDPDAFRPERFEGEQYDETVYRPFSDGTHSRFGAEAALMISTVFVVELAAGFRANVLRDGPAERSGNRHWSHWRPSRRLRISLDPLVAGPGEPSPPPREDD